MIKNITPQALFAVLKKIDEDTLQAQSLIQPVQRILICILFTGVCLLLVHYAKYTPLFHWLMQIGTGLDDMAFKRWLYQLSKDPYYELYVHAWWGWVHILGYLILPALLIKFYLKESLLQHGFQWGAVTQHLPWYLLLTAPILCFVVIVSFGDDFSSHYPFYSRAHRSWFDLLVWEAIYISQFIALEFFFRGFMLNALKPAFGSNAILVMCLPYLMIHFPKLWPEAFGALLFGLFLGILAMRSRSIWGGVGVHVCIAVAMDIAALIQTTGLPTKLMP